MNYKKSSIFILTILFLQVLTGCMTLPVHTASLKDVKADGSAPRLEREFKYSIKYGIGDFSPEELAEEVLVALTESIQEDGLWKAPGVIGNNYYTDDETEEFAYLDIYFDTEDNLNYENAVSYRLRERFKNKKDIKQHFKDPYKEKDWPYRIEFQAKVDRKELGEGFSEVMESRFEFREESEPFSKNNPPPESPWDLEEFISYFQSGEFGDYYTWPAKSVVEYLIPEKTDQTELYFMPELVLITERQRQHLNIETPWGSGPNPQQAFIISLDKSKVYDAEEFMDFVFYGEKMPDEKEEFVEIEVEFERNVSEELDKKIKKAEESGDEVALEKLTGARDAFLEDQKTIMKVIDEYFQKKGVEIVPAEKSKYVQAYELLYELDTQIDDKGVTIYNKEKAYPGYNLYTSSSEQQVLLIDMNGKIVHRWWVPNDYIWTHAELDKDGNLFVFWNIEGIHRSLVKLDWYSNIIWKRDNFFHHDIAFDDAGNIYTLVNDFNYYDTNGIKRKNNELVLLSPEGDFLKRIDMFPKLQKNIPDAIKNSIDIFHINTVELINKDINGLCKKDDILLAIRNLNLIGIFNMDNEEFIWLWGQGVLDHHHQPTLLKNGNFLLFDNGARRGYSRVIELNPLTEEIVWEYKTDPPEVFFSKTQGGSERLPNGNTLITEAKKNRVFEVTIDGEVVWEFINPELTFDTDIEETFIYRMTRIVDPENYKYLKDLVK